jgi:hypothetical protein
MQPAGSQDGWRAKIRLEMARHQERVAQSSAGHAGCPDGIRVAERPYRAYARTLLQLSRSGAHDAGARGLDPRDPRHIRSQDARAAARTLPARHHGRLVAALWRHASEHIATGILTLIEHLAPGDGLCHGDLYPGNVIMTADGPNSSTGGGDPCAARPRLAWCHFLHSELAPESVPDPERPRAVNAAMQSEYARLAGMSPAALTAAMEPYLPIILVRFLLGPAASPALRERLLRRVEAALNPED